MGKMFDDESNGGSEFDVTRLLGSIVLSDELDTEVEVS